MWLWCPRACWSALLLSPTCKSLSQADLRKGLEDKLDSQKYNQAKVLCGSTTCNLGQPTLLLKAMNKSISSLSWALLTVGPEGANLSQSTLFPFSLPGGPWEATGGTIFSWDISSSLPNSAVHSLLNYSEKGWGGISQIKNHDIITRLQEVTRISECVHLCRQLPNKKSFNQKQAKLCLRWA